MSLTPEEIKELKEQLYEQVKSLPEQQKQQVRKQIDSLSPEALEAMLKQQQESSSKEQKNPGKSIFRLIINGEITTFKIAENSSSVAVLDINPISKGHMIIIPKEQIKPKETLPKPIYNLANKLSKKIIKKLKASSTIIQTEDKFGEKILHIIPIYETELDLSAPRQKVSKEDLSSLKSSLEIKKTLRKKIIKIKTEKPAQSQVLKIPRRIA